MEEVERLRQELIGDAKSVAVRMRAIFGLRGVTGSDELTGAAVDALCECLRRPADFSVLVRHECGYVLGQMGDGRALPALECVLRDRADDEIVRHESAESIAAIARPDSIPLLKEFEDDPAVAVAETCQIGIHTIQTKLEREQNSHLDSELIANDNFTSVDPALPVGKSRSTAELREALLAADRLPLFDRYQAMFCLRNRGGQECVEALCAGLMQDQSALFQHEVAFVLGEMAEPSSFEALRHVALNPGAHEMTVHECLEAIGAIATPECYQFLEQFRNHKSEIVRESCETALDIADHHHSTEFEYVL